MSEFFNCPTCGQRLRVIGLGGGQHLGGGWQGLAEFDFAPPGAGALPAGAEFVRETPLAQPTIEGSVLVPALQSLLCGLAAGVLTAFPTAAWHWPWWSPLAAGGGVFALSWTVILADSRKLLRKVETWIGADLDGDGEIGPPAKASVSVTIEEAKQHGRRLTYAEFDASPSEVRRFAEAALGERLTVHGVGLSRHTFERLRAEALERGLVCWKDTSAHRLGLELTRAGRAVFEKLLEEL